MLKVLLLFLLLIAGIVLGPMLAGHQGYVLIQTDNYNIETSVTGLVIILILAVVVLFAVEWLLRRIFRTKSTLMFYHTPLVQVIMLIKIMGLFAPGAGGELDDPWIQVGF